MILLIWEIFHVCQWIDYADIDDGRPYDACQCEQLVSRQTTTKGKNYIKY